MECLQFIWMSLRVTVQWHFVSFHAVGTCNFRITTTNMQFVNLSVVARWICLSKVKDSWHAPQADSDWHFERFSRKTRLVMQLQPPSCIWMKRNKPSNKVKILYLSTHGVDSSWISASRNRLAFHPLSITIKAPLPPPKSRQILVLT
jgi:hypothetical protein